MKHEIVEKQGASVIVLRGDVDLSSSPEARKLLLSSIGGSDRVLVDLSGVTYIDSSGVASLVEALQASKKNGTLFALAAASEPTRRVLELARLDQVFTMYATVDEGINAAG
ncbi:MAG: STAS domain-containing protein [Gammaproteobacteria bacterium]